MGAWWLANWSQVAGFVTGAGSVIFAQRRSMWSYPIGVANELVFIVVFVPARLYADSALQVVFLALTITGWVDWHRARRAERDRRLARDESFVQCVPRVARYALAASGLAITALLWWLLTAFTDSTTQLADAATTAASLIAQYMLNRRWIQNWYVWAAVDVGYVGLYAYKGLWITALLYLGFIGLCVAGYRSWRLVGTRTERGAVRLPVGSEAAPGG